MIENLSGVIVWTENLDRLSYFYQETMGLTPHSIRDDFIAFKWDMGPYSVRFSLGKHSSVSGEAIDPYRIMMNFNVQDIKATTERLKSLGVIFVREPEREHWGGEVATFKDPDGNIIQLLQQPVGRQGV